MPARPKPTKKSAKKAGKKKEPKQPVTTPTVDEITQQIDNREIVNRKGEILQPIGPDRLRLMQADVMSAIVRRFNGEKLAKMLDELSQAESVTNGGKKIPDNRTRLSAATVILAYILGKPIERQEILNINMDADSAHNLAEKLKESPALRAAFRSILEQAERDGGDTTPQPATTIEAPASPVPPVKQANIRPKRTPKPTTDPEFEDD